MGPRLPAVGRGLPVGLHRRKRRKVPHAPVNAIFDWHLNWFSRGSLGSRASRLDAAPCLLPLGDEESRPCKQIYTTRKLRSVPACVRQEWGASLRSQVLRSRAGESEKIDFQ